MDSNYGSCPSQWTQTYGTFYLGYAGCNIVLANGLKLMVILSGYAVSIYVHRYWPCLLCTGWLVSVGAKVNQGHS